MAYCKDFAITYRTPVTLQPKDRAPSFTLPSSTGGKVSLGDFRGRRLVLYAFPAAMTPGCTSQACDFRDHLATFNDAGLAVVGLSPDPVDRLIAFAERDGLSFPLLSDPAHVVLEKYGAWGEKKLYGKTVVGVIRSTFVISPTGRIEEARYNIKATGHVAKLMRELQIPA
jgi:peroxiredoxin Q/BCP